MWMTVWLGSAHRAAREYAVDHPPPAAVDGGSAMPDGCTRSPTGFGFGFQRVPTVDTSNPFIARFIPTADRVS